MLLLLYRILRKLSRQQLQKVLAFIAVLCVGVDVGNDIHSYSYIHSIINSISIIHSIINSISSFCSFCLFLLVLLVWDAASVKERTVRCITFVENAKPGATRLDRNPKLYYNM